MKKFSKEELIGVLIIFLVLIGISLPNFALSVRRARDQVRRDDLGNIVRALDNYYSDFNSFPPSRDGNILACKRPEDKVEVDAKGGLIVDLIPCRWGLDAFVDLTPGSTTTYSKILPRDPGTDKGVSYYYISDGARYQLFASFEGKDEPEYDQKIADRNLMCGTAICNTGRDYNCSVEKSLETCQAEALMKNK